MADAKPVSEPYRDARQQHDAAMMGMYVFLGSEVMLFGGIFLVAAILRLLHPADVVEASKALHFGIGGVNTAVLLTSSLCVALAIEAGRRAAGRATAGWLASAALLGICFLAVKAFEYRMEYSEGLLPGVGSAPAISTSTQRLFMDLYLVATALHAVHLTIGIVMFVILTVLAAKGTIRLPQRAIVLAAAGLYWHLVDVIWVFLYPVFYLAR